MLGGPRRDALMPVVLTFRCIRSAGVAFVGLIACNAPQVPAEKAEASWSDAARIRYDGDTQDTIILANFDDVCGKWRRSGATSQVFFAAALAPDSPDYCRDLAVAHDDFVSANQAIGPDGGRVVWLNFATSLDARTWTLDDDATGKMTEYTGDYWATQANTIDPAGAHDDDCGRAEVLPGEEEPELADFSEYSLFSDGTVLLVEADVDGDAVGSVDAHAVDEGGDITVFSAEFTAPLCVLGE